MSELCLTLICPPAVEEKMLDLLLLSPNVTFFTSTATAAHGMAHEDLDQTEQVLGRARATKIQVIFAAADKAALLDAIRQQFSGAGLRYWVTTVAETGEIT
ncbi:MAG: hypothetical protein BGP20_13395 [Thiobacillus sp. 63-78]|uniref:DUF3240 family protein n=1 Tax=Thiobacillus sp. 63-78 TaxID=1895859 RepID=UPI00096058D8|nr:DUF3240 family protein [Thiobacillus sp. 63-78]MBN8762418.1 DUF3240 family protein [Thiobacillus sp.]OJZ17185.1 MAG: hypothetical protein BGP20_13395 [Thiobacillus sp. 63-78]